MNGCSGSTRASCTAYAAALFLERRVAHSMPIAPKILQFSGNLFSARIRVAEVHERTDHFLHSLVVFKKHVSLFLELGTALRMGVAIGSREGCVEVPGSMVEIGN